MSQPSSDPHVVYVQPNPGRVKLLGWLNVIFGMLILLFAACSGIVAIGQHLSQPLITAQFEQQQAREEARQAEREEQIAELVEAEAAATSDVERDRLREKRERLEFESRLHRPVDVTAFTKVGTDPKIFAFTIVDLVGALVLNVLLIASGIGLLLLAPWGRKLALFVAGAKLLRLCVQTAWNLVVIVPIVAAQMQAMQEQMFVDMPGGPPGGPPPEAMFSVIFAFQRAMIYGGPIIMLIIGAIYPLILIWLLTRPNARAVFTPQYQGAIGR